MRAKSLISLKILMNCMTAIIVACSGVHVANPGKKPPTTKSVIQFRWIYRLPNNIKSIKLYVRQIDAIDQEGQYETVFPPKDEEDKISVQLTKQHEIQIVGGDFAISPQNYENFVFHLDPTEWGDIVLESGKSTILNAIPHEIAKIKVHKPFSAKADQNSTLLFQLDLEKSIQLEDHHDESKVNVVFTPKLIAKERDFSIEVKNSYRQYSTADEFIRSLESEEKISVPTDLETMIEEPANQKETKTGKVNLSLLDQASGIYCLVDSTGGLLPLTSPELSCENHERGENKGKLVVFEADYGTYKILHLFENPITKLDGETYYGEVLQEVEINQPILNIDIFP